jgi:hypothetical protein
MTNAEVITREESLRQVIETADADVTVVAPNFETLQALGRLDDPDWGDHVRILTTPQPLKRLRHEFTTATRIAEISSRNDVTIRTIDDQDATLQPLVLTESQVTTVLLSGMESVPTLRTSVEPVLENVHETVAALWRSAQTADISTPPYSQVMETVGENFDGSFEADVQTMLSTAMGSRAMSDGLDEVHAFLLLAARNREQYRELTKWAERIQIGSPARFSTRKKELENAGLLTTEKIERETVGRPRQRLLLTDQELQEAPLNELVATAQAVL